MTKRILMLEDGNYFIGDAIGSEKKPLVRLSSIRE